MDIKTVLASGSVPCLVPHRCIALCLPPIFSNRPSDSFVSVPSRTTCGSEPLWCSSCTTSPSSLTPKPVLRYSYTPTLFASGDDAGLTATFLWRTKQDGGVSPGFPPRDEAIVKAIACEAVSQTQLPLSRLSLADLATQASAALGQPISRTTIGRILDADAIKPWRYEYWIFPRDPQFEEKAGRVLDLYAGLWQGQPLGPHDHIISADEKTSIQARMRCHPSLSPAPGRKRRVEHEYDRGGALQYLAAWDVQRGYIMGRCEPSTGIEPFGRLVTQVMEQEPYRSAERVFWVVDNGSSHRGHTAMRRLGNAYANAILVHTPVHASWLNQVEIYFSIVQRKVLTPNDFASVEEVAQRLRLYEALANQQPRPFMWKFTRAKLAEFLKRLASHDVMMHQGQAVQEIPDTDQDEPLAA